MCCSFSHKLVTENEKWKVKNITLVTLDTIVTSHAYVIDHAEALSVMCIHSPRDLYTFCG
jgi:hypothetical protein